MNKLQELELEDLPNLNTEEAEKETKRELKIHSLDEANQVLRKLKAINEKIREIENLAQKEIEPYELEIFKINKWRYAEVKAFDGTIDFFNFLLEQYYREQRELDPKFKLSTPNGKVSSRKQQPSWNYDEEKVVNFLYEKMKDEEYKDLLRIKYEPNKSLIKEKFIITGKEVWTADGEIVEGITVEERPDTISIKVVE